MLNSINLMGRFTRDPELKQTNSGKSVVSFTLACDRDTKDKETDFINCTAWNSTAEFISKYFNKGSMAVVNGRLQLRSYEDKNGNKREAAEILVNNAYFGGAKNTTPVTAPEDVPTFEDVSVDDLPF